MFGKFTHGFIYYFLLFPNFCTEYFYLKTLRFRHTPTFLRQQKYKKKWRKEFFNIEKHFSPTTSARLTDQILLVSPVFLLTGKVLASPAISLKQNNN